jgi:magnesium chelatase subunit D
VSDTVWTDSVLAAALFAVDRGTGGLSVRALPGPVRDRFLGVQKNLLPPEAPLRRLPLHAADDRLLGGLDLAATLSAGRPVAARGLLAEANGGVVIVAMAERVGAGVAARLAAALDSGEVVAERDGLSMRSAAAIGVVALDEGIAEDERPAAALVDRLAFLVDLTGVGLRDVALPAFDWGHVKAGRALLGAVEISENLLEALASAAAALGVASLRALLLAVRAARASAALGGRREVAEADAMAAMRLVLAPRATRLPSEPPGPEEAQQAAEKEQQAEAPAENDEETARRDEQPLGEIMLEAARAAMPAGLLEKLLAGKAARARTPAAGRAGAIQHSLRRGRPIGVRRGELKAGARLNLVETLRAAAPWQRLRRGGEKATRVFVEPGDFRITRFRQRTETTTIFVVDASGSAALNRLAEAKGAVELVLADCYVRRDRVALIAFRGSTAEVLLPPTGSLVRAKRSLAGLPGGGGTPLASGIEAGFALADAVRRRGQSPIIIVLSDGRANVGRDGTAGRVRAEADALAAGRMLRGEQITCVLVDTSPRPAPPAKKLAGEMGALYLPLPYADADAVSRAVKTSTRGASTRA